MNDVIENGNAYPLAAEGDRWTPVLQGKVFCSPACGSRCKKADYERATQRAAALVQELGPGWQPRIWENGGWYFEVTKSSASVSEVDGGYRADMRFDFGTRHQLCVAETRANARAAVEAVIARVERDIAGLRRQLLAMAPAPHAIEDARFAKQDA
ncbi:MULTISPECIES: hypothetical protein [Cupriavidus]